MVRVRYRGTPYRARVLPEGEFAAKVKFLEPARAPAPGQAAVFYDNEEVLGGGIIVKLGICCLRTTNPCFCLERTSPGHTRGKNQTRRRDGVRSLVLSRVR